MEDSSSQTNDKETKAQEERGIPEWQADQCKKAKEGDSALWVHVNSDGNSSARYATPHLCQVWILTTTTGSSPPTPEGFIIRTPSPKFATSLSMFNVHSSIPEDFFIRSPSPIFTTSTSISTLNVHPPMNVNFKKPIDISPVLMDSLPFH